MNQKGFSIKELLFAVVGIGILCTLAIPKYYSLHHVREKAKVKKVIMTVQSAVQKSIKDATKPHTSYLVSVTNLFPTQLDEEESNQMCKNCFSDFLDKGLSDPLWYKVSDLEYLYSVNGNHTARSDFEEPGDLKIKYNPKSGMFLITKFK